MMTTSLDAHERRYSHINGSTQDLLERLAVSELCKGWPVYRDSSEWKNYRDMFSSDAVVWTTWSKARPIDEFIAISKRGKDKGDFIMHRECGTLVELAQDHGRAIGKMKATITQRFKTQDPNATAECPVGAEYDVDCDCRFIFFCFKDPEAGSAWKTKYVKLFYEKDKVVPVDGTHGPVFDQPLLDSFPEGYKYLGAAQSSLGYPVAKHLPTARDHDSWFKMYKKMEQWLSGSDVDLWCSDDGMSTQVISTERVGNGRVEASETKNVGADQVCVPKGFVDMNYNKSSGNAPTPVKLKEINGNELTNGNHTHLRNGSSTRKRKSEKMMEEYVR